MHDKTLVLKEEGYDECGMPHGQLQLPIHQIDINQHTGKEVEFTFTQIDDEGPRYELVIHVPENVEVTAFNKIVRRYPK